MTDIRPAFLPVCNCPDLLISLFNSHPGDPGQGCPLTACIAGGTIKDRQIYFRRLPLGICPQGKLLQVRVNVILAPLNSLPCERITTD